MNEWFNLLGPAQFISRIIDGFRDGLSYVLQLPYNIHADLMDAITQALQYNELVWEYIYSEPTLEPIDILYTYFNPGGRAVTEDARLRELYRQPEFKCKVLIPKAFPESSIPAWVGFMERFAHFTRNNINQAERTEILLIVVSDRRPLVKQSDPLLANKIVDDIVQKCDMVYFAHQLLAQQQRSPEKIQLHAEIAATLALWDFRLCEKLCRIQLNQLLDFCNAQSYQESTVYRMLLNYAQESGWQEITENSNEHDLWRAGIQHGFENQSEEHSAYLAIKGQHKKLCKRVWTAQITVLFPIIEKYRQHYVNQYRNFLIEDRTAYNGQTYDCHIENLEIGQIWYQLYSHKKIPERSRKHLTVLRNVRNEIAHGKVVLSEDVNNLLIPIPN